ncbi:hypothetical protein NQ317_010794 [Molorchus minor]|uniref:Uncharacterized protein n=1 Tax=Molorchus minor TaxID=1323400 RepID=A0ABQ9J192_9CUCU|nr:hypothetical protein NQ317_010794 [Molorchus minor]
MNRSYNWVEQELFDQRRWPFARYRQNAPQLLIQHFLDHLKYGNCPLYHLVPQIPPIRPPASPDPRENPRNPKLSPGVTASPGANFQKYTTPESAYATIERRRALSRDVTLRTAAVLARGGAIARRVEERRAETSFSSTPKFLMPRTRMVSGQRIIHVHAVKISRRSVPRKALKSAVESENILTYNLYLYVGEAALPAPLQHDVAGAMCRGMNACDS